MAATVLVPTAAQAQSLGCNAVNDGAIDFTAKIVNGDPRQPETTSRNVTNTYATSMIRTVSGYTDATGNNFVPGILPFTIGDRLNFTARVTQYSGVSGGVRLRFRINNTIVGLPTGARSPDATAIGTYTGYYTVASGLQDVGMSVDHPTYSSTTTATVTCTPYVDSSLTLGVSMSHSGAAQQGGTVDYTITPSASGAGTGTDLRLTFSLPSGMTYNDGSGSGWTCTSTRCTYSNTIANGASGNPLTLRVNIASNAATSLTPSVTLSGGNAGSSVGASDATTIDVVQVPASVTLTGGDNQAATTGAAFATPLSVTVKDGSNAVIANTAVTFTAPASGASGTFSNSSNTITVNTDASGVANAGTFTANSSGGSYAVTATAGSVSANFSMTNNAIVAPTVTALSPTGGPTTGGTTVVLTGNGFIGATAVSFGGTAAASFNVDSATQITATTPAASAGTVNVTVTTANGTSTTSASDQFTYAVMPTTPTLSSTPPALTNSANATFQFSLATGTAQCSIDGGPFVDCTSPVNISGLPDGSHSFAVRATNAAGTSTAATYSWTVDATAPNAPVVISPAASSERAVTNLTVTGTSEADATITVYLDGSSDGTTTADGSGNWTYTLTSLSAGSHAVKARAADAAGNSSGDSATRTFTAYSALAATQVESSYTGSVNLSTFNNKTPIVGSGGKTPYSYALSGGTLPSGLSFASAIGAISGTPTSTLAATDFTVTITDAIGQTASNTFRLTIVSDRTQTIVFTSTAPASARVGGGTYAPSAISSSNLAVALTIDASSSSVCSLSGASVSYIGVGTCTINANQAGNTNYDAAAQVQQSFAVGKGVQVITFGALPDLAITASPAPLSASAGSGLAVAFTSNTTAVCTVSGATITLVSQGVCTIAANQAGDTNWNAANEVTRSFTVLPPTLVIVEGTISPGTTKVGAVFSQSNTASGGVAPYSFSVSAGTLPAGLTLDSGTGDVSGTPTTAGAFSYTIAVSDSAMPATIATANAVSGTIEKGDQTLSFTSTPPSPAPVGGGDYTVAATSSVALTPSFAIDPASSAVCTISGSTVSFTGGGDCIVVATQAGNANYNAAPSINQTISVAAAPVAADRSNVVIAYASTGTAIDLSASITGGAHTALTVTTAPAHGTATVSGDIVTYTPTAGYVGSDSFIYTATGPGGTSAPATVTLTVEPPAAPTVANVSADVPFGSAGQAIRLTPSGVYTTLAIDTAPTLGTVTLDGATATYVPAAGSSGTDSFTYVATGPGGTSAAAMVTVTIAAPPPPTAESVNVDAAGTSVANGSSVAIDLSSLITGTFTSIEIATPPTNGTLTLNAPGAAPASARRSAASARAMGAASWTAVYAPNPGFTGQDSFQFVAVGPGGRSALASVQIDVSGQAPTAQPKTASVGDAQTVSVELTEGAVGGPFTAATIDNVTPANGVTTAIVKGGPDAAPTFRLDVAAKAHFGGLVVVRYRLANAFGTSDPAEVTITVTARPDPSADPVVRAISDSQAETARRFARTQVSNFMARTQQLHNGGGATRPIGVGVSLRDLAFNSRAPDNTVHDAATAFDDRNQSILGRSVDGTYGDPTQTPVNSRAAPQAPHPAGDTAQAGAEEGGGAYAGPAERPIGSLALWTGGSIEVGTLDRQSGRAKITVSSGGLSGGADVRIATGATIGLGVGYGSDVSLIDGEAARVESETTVVAAYGSFAPVEGAFVDAMIGYGSLDYRTSRAVKAIDRIALGTRNGTMTFGAVSLGIDRQKGALRWSGYGRLEWLHGTLDAYSETDAERYALRFDRRNLRSLIGLLGARLEFPADIGFGRMVPRIGAEWLHEFQGAGVQGLDYADYLDASTYRIAGTGWQREQYQILFGNRMLLPEFWTLDVELGVRGAARESVGHIRFRVSKAF